MYAMIRHYEFDPKESDTVNHLAQDILVPALKRIRGFIRYDWINNGNGEGASFSVFQDKESAEESLRVVTALSARYHAGLRITSPAVIGGDLIVHALSGPTAVVSSVPKSA